MKSFWTNYHSHSHYCDGVESPEAQVQAALRQGVAVFGFSTHCPVPFVNLWSMKQDRLDGYLAETRALKQKYADQIELYVGLEIDYIPGLCGPSDYVPQLDFTIGSVHYLGLNWDGNPWEIDGATAGFVKGLVEVHGGDIRSVIQQYYGLIRRMVREDRPDIVGHLDKIKIHNTNNSLFDEQSDWYLAEVEKTLEAMAEAGCIVEVNTRGVYKKGLETYPSVAILERMRAKGIPVMINSDSHGPAEITLAFAETARQLQQVGYKTVRVFIRNEWRDVPFDEYGLRTL
ncbi:histidinol-phosphatase [Telluribacter sp.]|jgi:histidinol-phosphatase (PHP family)|uniref:histidinol-phosphatase n=1 Tax=Telluribacter sp. TaxID=1978767 RepID=UPI002E140F81|nr:histidinol-phosphatase [Telluribacter sp.]